VLVVLQRLPLPLVITDEYRECRGADQQRAAELQQFRQFRRQPVAAIQPTTSVAEFARVLRRFHKINANFIPRNPLDLIKQALYAYLEKEAATLRANQEN
jgi:hypothetical protein